MSSFIAWISTHAPYAHWVIFASLLLAGINIPLSADLLVLTAAMLAALVIPEHTPHLFFAVFIGCYLSAWNSYWLGRLAGKKLLKFRWFSKLLPEKRVQTIQTFYKKHGLVTLILGRFIPFGVRNCIFFTSGISRLSFIKFALYDLFASFLWSSVLFYTFYSLAEQADLLYQNIKIVNLSILAAFIVTLISLIWYKRRKKSRTPLTGENL